MNCCQHDHLLLIDTNADASFSNCHLNEMNTVGDKISSLVSQIVKECIGPKLLEERNNQTPVFFTDANGIAPLVAVPYVDMHPIGLKP